MIIGLTGLKGCGKSTVAEIMRETYGYSRHSFAEPIKDMLEAMGLTKDELYDPKLKEVVIPEFGKSPREIMQLLGTEFGRSMIKSTIWVDALMRKINAEEKIVIDDVRFPNEAAAIHARGGKIVRVIRDNPEQPVDNHISEQGLDSEQIDYEVSNISCYRSDLELSVAKTLEEILYYGAILNPQS